MQLNLAPLANGKAGQIATLFTMQSLETHINRYKIDKLIFARGGTRFGFLRAWYLSRLKARLGWIVPSETRVEVRCAGRLLSLPIRYNTDDAVVFQGVFADREYESESVRTPVQRILDLGSNCGFALAFLAAKWPTATFGCVEPDPRNLIQLAKTIRMNGIRARTFSAAVGSSECFANLYIDDSHPSRNRLESRSSDGLSVSVLTLHKVLTEMNWRSVDLIKMDIEGAEYDVVVNSGELLQKGHYIMFELHNWVAGDEIFACLRRWGFDVKPISLKHEQTYLATNTMWRGDA